MSTIAASGILNDVFTIIDQICDYVPIISTVTNLVDIFEKCAFKFYCSSIHKSNRYFSYINDKSILRCTTLLVPILGNILVGVYDLNEKHNEIKFIKMFDEQILEMHWYIEKFKNIIENPDEPLGTNLSELMLKFYAKTHKQKISLFWPQLKLFFAYKRLINTTLILYGLDQNKAILQKQKEISELKKESSQLRQTSYRKYLETIEEEELLKEAKKYYLMSFLPEEHASIKESIKQMTLDTILPELKKRVLTPSIEDYDFLEMREIISQIENKYIPLAGHSSASKSL